MTETTLTTMDVQALVKLSVETVLLLELRNVTTELTMLMLPTNAKQIADSQDVVMDLLILMKNVIILHLDNLWPPAETHANPHIVVTELSTQFWVKSVIPELTTMTSQALDVQLVAHKTLVDTTDPLLLVILTEPLLAQDVSMDMLDHQPDHHAQDPFNG